MIDVAILGCGRIGQVHARSLDAIDGARCAYVCDARPEAADALAARTGAGVVSAEEAVERADAVVIATPTETHLGLVLACAASGTPALCEKPVDLDAARVEEAVAAVEAVGIPFMVGFNRRFDPGFALMECRIREGEIGEVEHVTILSRDPAPPPIGYVRTSGGLFRDMTIHDLDMARFLLGEEPVRVHAAGSCLVESEIGAAGDVDTAAVTLVTASGRLCQIANSRRATYGYDQRIEVHGSRGMIRAANVSRHNVETATGSGFASAALQPFFLERYAEAYVAEMTYFVGVVRDGRPARPDGRDGLAAQRLADAATASCRDGAPRDV